MKKVEKVEISLNESFRIFEQSFNRLKYFSCISENITQHHMPSDWLIESESGLHFKMRKPNEDNIFNIISGYKKFMRLYLIRDCIDSYALSLDKFFMLLLLNKKRIASHQPIIHGLDEAETLT